MYQLTYPECLLLLTVPFIVRLLPPLRRRQHALRFPSVISVREDGAHSTLIVRMFGCLKWIYLYLGWAAICIAVCYPVCHPESEKEIKERRNILLATDISLSMDTRDWYHPIHGKPISRWEAVKEMVARFTASRPGDRFAHVVFGQEAYLQVPFTQDVRVLVEMQEKIQLGDAGPKTSIGNAIAVAVKHFKSDSITRKVMLLVTDGLDTQDGISPVQMAEEAAKDSVRIYTIAMGSPEKGFGNVNHRQLEQIASQTGGRCFLASSSEDLKKVMQEIDAAEPVEYVLRKEVPARPLYPYPLVLALGIFGTAAIVKFINDLK